MLLQLTYISTPRGAVTAPELAAIVDKSRRNNRRDAITGLLFHDGTRFLQALEGPDGKVRAAFARIKADPRHLGVVILSERQVEAREFGEWEMASRAVTDSEDALVARLSALAAKAAPAVRATFDGLARVRRTVTA
jgi:hypothetical protein